jgi:quinol monooxygenase YgiN
MRENNGNQRSTDRRDVLKVSAGALAALAGLGAVATTRAQGTPEPVGTPGRVGLFGVTRSYVVKDDADVDELNAIVEGFVAIVSAEPGFISYDIIYDDATRGYITIGVFDNRESAEASNEAAADFRAEHNLADFYVDPEPVIVQGAIVISSGG